MRVPDTCEYLLRQHCIPRSTISIKRKRKINEMVFFIKYTRSRIVLLD